VKYAWIKAHISLFPVTVMCKVLEVSKSGYFGSLNAVPSKTKEKRKVIAEKAAKFHKDSREIYGYRKVYEDIAEEGEILCCEETVRRVMQEEGLYSRTKRKFKVVTTNSNHDYRVPENILDRDFKAVRPNQKWVADITYVATVTGWVYLATVMDLYSRKIVGWELSEKIDGELVISAMKKALNARDCNEELIHHSDRGVQYASDGFRDLLDLNGIECSMSRKGNCWASLCRILFQ
jgi:putative transposase